MTLALEPIVLPLDVSEKGVVYIRGSRVPIDFIIYDYLEGATAEDVVQNYPSLQLSDIHAVLSYYLSHKQDVIAYLLEQEKLAEMTYQQLEQQSNQKELRQRLLARLGS